MSAQVVVCGSSGSLPGPGRACSGYLVRSGTAQVVLDLGNGALANLLRHVEAETITDVVVSHGHHDHYADLIGLWQLVTYGLHGPERLRVWARAETIEVLERARRDHAEHIEALELREVVPDGPPLQVGGFSLEAFEAWHSEPGMLTRLTDEHGRVIAYTGDSDLSDELVRGAAGADLLVSEASWVDGLGELPRGVHMTGRQAGQLAARSEVGALLVTHVWPELDPADAAAQAAEEYQGPVHVATDGLVLTV